MEQLDQEIVKIYKFSRDTRQNLPPPLVHVYMASLAQHQAFSNPIAGYSSVIGVAIPEFSQMIAHSKEDMETFIAMDRLQRAHSIPYVIARMSAEFHFALNATLSPDRRDSTLAQFCYDVAAHYSRRLQRSAESETLEHVAAETPKLIRFMSGYHAIGKDTPLTEEDYRRFETELIRKARNDYINNQEAFTEELRRVIDGLSPN
jgi:hypothetical protein